MKAVKGRQSQNKFIYKKGESQILILENQLLVFKLVPSLLTENVSTSESQISGKTVKGNARIQVMNMMETNVRGYIA